MNGAFTTMRTTLSALTPALEGVGRATGRLIDGFAEATKPGTEGFKQINDLVLNSTPLFARLTRAAGTLGLALIRSFNRGNPLVQSMVGWIETLINRFDTFTRSDGFDVWMGNARRVFGSLGPLLDATGRALNDLVNPDSVKRTTDFLDRLTSFMPRLAEGLNVLGSFDLFGVLAAGLDAIGKGLEPLVPALTKLGETVRDRLIVFLDAFGASLKVVAQLTTPLVVAFTDLLNAIPTPVIRAAAVAVTALGVAFVGLKIASVVVGISKAISTGIQYIGLYAANLREVGGMAAGLPAKFAGIVGKAGVFGLVAAGALAAIPAINSFIRTINDTDDKSRDAVATNLTVADSITKLGYQYGITSSESDRLGTSFRDVQITSAMLPRYFDEIAKNSGNLFDTLALLSTGARSVEKTLADLDVPLSSLAQTNLPAAQEQFRAYANELGASGDQITALLDKFPEFKKVLEQSATANGDLATTTDLANAAMGVESARQQEAAAKAAAHTSALNDLSGKATTATSDIDGLADAIRGFGSKALDARDANRQFQSAIDSATKTIADNTKTLDTGTQAGRENEAALDAIAKSSLNSAAATYEQTGSVEKATSAINKGKDALIAQLAKFNITGAAAEAYAKKLDLTPDNIETFLRLNGVSQAEGSIDRLTRDRQMTVYLNAVGGASWTKVPGGRFAAGGVLHGPRQILAGEAGREAIVPLDRPLGAVDPSVRWLSAIAQGMKPKSMASGGIAGGGTTVNVQPGAIVVQGSNDPARTANEVLNRLFERVG